MPPAARFLWRRDANNRRCPVMNAYAEFIARWNRRTRRFTIYDVKLLQGAAMGLILVAAESFPSLMKLDVVWFVAWAVLCALRPMWVVFKTQ